MWLINRIRHWNEITRPIVKIVAAILFVIGLYDLARSEGPVGWQSWPTIYTVTKGYFPDWDWYIWIILVLIILILGIAEGSYRFSSKNTEPKETEVTEEEDKWVPIYQVVDYVRNAIGDNNEGECYPETLIAIRQAALNAEIRIIGKAELRHRAGYHDDIDTKINPDYWQTNKFALLATSPAYTTHYHTQPIKYIDGFRDHRWSLQVSKNDVMKKWPDGPEAAFANSMPLGEACRIAYEQTQGSLASVAAEKTGGRNEVLNWYANIIINTFGIALFGARPPSTKVLFIENLGNTHFADGAERLVDNHNGNIEYVNLSIRPNDLDEAIQRIMALDKPI